MEDEYYSRNEVSNSDLTTLKNYLEGKESEFPNKEQVYYFGNLFDAMVTESTKIDFKNQKFNNIPVDPSLFSNASKMKYSFLKDPFAFNVAKNSKKQTVIIDNVSLTFKEFTFTLLMRCKLDFDLSHIDLIADLKSTAATSEDQFISAVDMFDYDRQAAVYMSLAKVNRFAIIGVSKKNAKVFKVLIDKDSEFYKSGMEKFTDLAFKWWTLFC